MNNGLDQYVKLIPFLGEALGSTFQAMLFDLTDPACPVLAGVNASEDDQERLREFVLRASGSSMARKKGRVMNHPLSVDYVKMMKASILFLPDGEGMIVGALCLGMQCDLAMKVYYFMSELLQFSTENFDEPEIPVPPSVSQEPSLDSIEEMVREFDVEPGRVSLDERMEIITELYDLGVYNLKGAVARTAEVLQISEQSVYRYLSKIKRARN